MICAGSLCSLTKTKFSLRIRGSYISCLSLKDSSWGRASRIYFAGSEMSRTGPTACAFLCGHMGGLSPLCSMTYVYACALMYATCMDRVTSLVFTSANFWMPSIAVLVCEAA